MGLKWKLQRGGGFKPKNLPWEGDRYFLKQHNTAKNSEYTVIS